MRNIKSTINDHNNKILEPQCKNENKCNCINKESCPLQNECLTSNIIYEATISTTSHQYEPKIYYGLCETKFKVRYANHKKSFSNRKYNNETELASEYWRLRDSNITPIIKWKIKRKCSKYKPNSRHCNLCLNEKLFILEHKSDNILNKRTELVNKCRHENKFYLSRFKPKT